jgi:hypothetical protein
MRWLFQLFFLERFSWLSRFVRPPFSSSVQKTKGNILYQTELESLVWFLQDQLQERVYYSVNRKGQVIIGTAGETIAQLSLHPKGDRKKLIYIAVRLEDGYAMYKAWFQLAFIGFKVRFRKPTLTLQKSWMVPTRGQ